MQNNYNNSAPNSPKLLRLFWVGCFLVITGVMSYAQGINLTVTVDVGPANCTSATGIAAAVVGGGAPPYTYAWSNGETTQIIQNLAPGTYTVTVTDNVGSQASGSGTVLSVNTLSVTIPPPPYATCAGSCDADIAAIPSGGTPPYTYNWSPANQDTFFLSDVCEGDYSVTVTDAAGCTATASNTIELSPEGVWVMTVPTDVKCFGGSDGSAEAKPMTGEPPYTYIWSDNQTTKIATGLTAGKYYVTVTDANGCTNRDSTIVNQPPQINITTTPSPTACGQSTGSVTSSVSGGTPPYTYAWSNGGTTDAITGLAAGTYTLTLTDANDCESIVPNIVIGDDCGGCTANAGTLIAVTSPVCLTGGSTTISATHQVNPTVPAGYETIYVLTSGPDLIIQQTNNIPSFIVTELGLYTIHTLVYDPNTLDLSIIVPGTTTGFDVNALLLQGGGTICAALDVAGAKISVIDCSSCDPPKVESVVVVEASCDLNDGRATINVVGGFFNFNYTWSNNISSENFATGLSPGTYTVTISRSNDPSCNTVESFTVGAKDGPDVEVVQVTPATCGESNGTATLSPFGLIYEWCNGEVGNNAISLPAGECYVKVTDPTTNCVDYIQVDIPVFNPLMANPIVNVQPDCGVANGSVTIQVTGGSFSYEFAWSDNGPATASRTDLLPGVYAVTVTDLGPTQCETVANFILGAAGVDATVEVDSVAFTSCAGTSDATVNINVIPGPGFVLPASVQIVNAGGTIFTNGQLPVGSYCVLVTDANGCPATGPCFEVKEPNQIDVDLAVFNKTCTVDGIINVVSTTGGNGGYVYDWEDILGTDDQRDRAGLNAGSYELTVTDAKGCSVSVDALLIEDECLCVPPVIESVVVVESQCGQSTGTASVNVVNGGAYNYTWTPNVSSTNAASDLPAGVYTVEITDPNDNTCTLTETFTVGNADGPKPTVNITSATCAAADGTVTFSPDTYTYQWSVGPNGFSRTDLAAGRYFVTVTDPNRPDCPNYITVDVDANSSLITATNVIQLPNCQQADGSVEIQVSGGSGTYEFLWDDGNTNASRTDLSGGIHRVTVTEVGGSGCEAVVDFLLPDNVPNATVNVQPVVFTSCPGVDDGLVNVLGGLTFSPGFAFPPNIRITDNGNNTYVNGQLAPGSYCLVIRDANDCVAGGACFEVVPPDQIDLDLAVFDEQCDDKGEILVTELSGGNPGYTFDWKDIAGTDNIQDRPDLDGGDYCLTVTDTKGCSVAANLKVEEIDNLTASFTAEYDNCEPGSITVQFNGNDNNLTGLIWDWTFDNGTNQETSADQNPTFTVTANSTLDVTLIVETASGCVDTTTQTLDLQPIELSLEDTVLACNGAPTEINPSGNTSYTYVWSPVTGLDDPTAANPTATSDTTIKYTVQITNFAGSDTCSIVQEVLLEVVNVDTSANPEFTSRQCEDLTVDFSVDSIDVSLYTWDFGDPDNPTASGTGSQVSHTYGQAGTFTVRLRPLASAKCLDEVFEFQVEVVDAPLFSTGFELDYESCSDTAVLRLSDTSSHVLGYDIDQWNWRFSTGSMGSSTDSSTVISITESGDLTVNLLITTENGCVDSIEQTFTINVIELDLQDTITACPGDTVFLNPNGNQDQIYSWTPAALLNDAAIPNPYYVANSGTQVFTVEASDAAGLCSLTKDITVIAGSNFSDFTLSQRDTVACGDVPVTLNVSATDGTLFEWSRDRNFEPVLETGTELDIMSGERGDSEIYYVRVSDALGCNIIDSVEVSNRSVIYEIEEEDEIVCKGDTLPLTVTIAFSAGDDVTTEWIPGGIVVDNSDPNFPLVIPEVSGMLILNATNQYGCTASDSVNIEVVALEEGLVATADPDTIFRNGNPTQLNVNAPAGSIIEWFPNDGMDSGDEFIANPKAAPLETTDYTVEVMDETETCAATRSVTVVVVDAPCGEPYIFLPNAFTPNSDGRNDILFLRGINVTEMWLIIYNRWGEKVFETRDQSRGWDGTFKGRQLSSDVYGYYLRVVCDDGEEFKKKGNISLLK